MRRVSRGMDNTEKTNTGAGQVGHSCEEVVKPQSKFLVPSKVRKFLKYLVMGHSNKMIISSNIFKRKQTNKRDTEKKSTYL